MFFMYIRRK